MDMSSFHSQIKSPDVVNVRVDIRHAFNPRLCVFVWRAPPTHTHSEDRVLCRECYNCVATATQSALQGRVFSKCTHF